MGVTELAASQRPSVSRAWIARYGLLYLGLNTAWAAPSQILIAAQIQIWYPGDKEAWFAGLMAAGGITSLIATPTAGLISDRTRSRYGRRAPAILLGALVSALALVVMGFAPHYWLLVTCWVVFQTAIAFAVNATQAVAPDQVPTRQYGLVSGVLGFTYTLGVVVGTVIGSLLDFHLAYVVTAGVTFGLAVQFLLTFKDPQVIIDRPGVSSRARLWAVAAEFVESLRKSRDFAWVFWTRLLVTLGQAIALFYLFYYLRDRIGYADPETGVLILTGVYAALVFATAILGGWASDVVGRRLPFVAGASVGVASCSVIMAFAGSFVVVVVAAGILGVAWGIYMAVDQALINEVLPSAADRGRDMGVMNIAVALPNATAPVVAYFALNFLGGYPGLYLLAAVLCLVGALLIYQVRKVR